jgi:hypothetical protein
MKVRRRVEKFQELGPPLQRSREEARYNCPWCEEETGKRSKGKLYFNLKKRVGGCWQCNTVVVDDHNLDIGSLYENYFRRPDPSLKKTMDRQRYRLAGWTKPAMEVDWARDYLIKGRGFTTEQIEAYSVRAAESPERCVILPDQIYPGLTTNFFQLRYLRKEARLKYTNPRDALKPIYGQHTLAGKKKAFICEGCFSSISQAYALPEWGAVATYGKSVTSDQAKAIGKIDIDDWCFVYDGGEIRSIIDAATTLYEALGRTVYFLILPYREDPNSLRDLASSCRRVVPVNLVSSASLLGWYEREHPVDDVQGDWEKFARMCAKLSIDTPT